jgi:hypothetical protein
MAPGKWSQNRLLLLRRLLRRLLRLLRLLAGWIEHSARLLPARSLVNLDRQRTHVWLGCRAGWR